MTARHAATLAAFVLALGCGGRAENRAPRVPWPTPAAEARARTLARETAMQLGGAPRVRGEVGMRVDTSRLVPGLVYYRATYVTGGDGGRTVVVGARDTAVVALLYGYRWRWITRGWEPADDAQVVAACAEALATSGHVPAMPWPQVVTGPEGADTIDGIHEEWKPELRRVFHAPRVQQMEEGAKMAEFWSMGETYAERVRCRFAPEQLHVYDGQFIPDVRHEWIGRRNRP